MFTKSEIRLQKFDSVWVGDRNLVKTHGVRIAFLAGGLDRLSK